MMKKNVISNMIRAGLSRQQAEAAFDVFTDSVIKSISRGEAVTLRGFGAFKPFVRPARWGRDFQNNERFPIKAQPAVKFVAGTSFQEFMQAQFDLRKKEAAAQPVTQDGGAEAGA